MRRGHRIYVKEKMALVQSRRSVAYIYLIVASRTMVFDLSGNLSSALRRILRSALLERLISLDVLI